MNVDQTQRQLPYAYIYKPDQNRYDSIESIYIKKEKVLALGVTVLAVAALASLCVSAVALTKILSAKTNEAKVLYASIASVLALVVIIIGKILFEIFKYLSRLETEYRRQLEHAELTHCSLVIASPDGRDFYVKTSDIRFSPKSVLMGLGYIAT